MKRRDFMISASAAAAGAALLPKMAFAAANRIDWYTSSDQNIIDFWTNIIKPKFEAANPGVTLNLVDAGDSAGLQAIEARAVAALASKADPQADFFEGSEARLPPGALEAGVYVDFSKAGLSNYSKLNPLAADIPQNITYRGSQVLLAYDTTKLPADKAPKTWADLVAWIKANPGQFIYNRPDKGGSGGNFVVRAIWEANGRDPSKFTVDNYKPETGDPMLQKGFDILKDLAPSLMDQGAYTSGNTQSIQLLSQGAVTMIPAWSDQALSAIKTGVLPETTGLVQLSDLALAGGFTKNTIPVNGVNKAQALKLQDFILTEEIQSAIITELGGFPGVSWDYVSKDLHDKYKDVIPASIPTWPGGDWDKNMKDGWYRNVAPNVDRNA
ncbi:MAG: extracellular solute-binding protein [Devosia sp.]|jgi:putative spermidine/putrescine transport system substrate-binding protein